MTQITVKNSAGSDVAVARVVDTGRAADASSLPVAVSNEDVVLFENIEAAVNDAETAVVAGNALLTAAVASLSVIDDWDSTDALKTVGFLVNISGNFTRPADTTAYAVNDAVANSTTAGSVVPISLTVARITAGSFLARKARLSKTGTSITNAAFRLHFFSASPTSAGGDNAAWSTDKAANYLGAMDVFSMTAFTDGAAGNAVPVTGSELGIALASGQIIYCLLQALAAYTPASAEIFTVILEAVQN